MSAWAKIEIEFPPDVLDPNEVMAFLVDHFKHPSGVPTATVTLVGQGLEPEPVAGDVVETATGCLIGGRIFNRPYTPGTVTVIADALAAQYPAQKIQAIKTLRDITRMGLKEAKDEMDDAYNTLLGKMRGTTP